MSKIQVILPKGKVFDAQKVGADQDQRWSATVIDRICEAYELDPKDTKQTLLFSGVFVAALLFVLGLIAAWVAACIYWIVPLGLDASAGIGFLRIFLAVGGSILIGVVYAIGVSAVASN